MADDGDNNSKRIHGRAAETERGRRPKRTKYTPVACDGCRQRKLKCLPSPSGTGCQRCRQKGIAACSLKSQHQALPAETNAGVTATLQALCRDVKILKEQLASWTTAPEVAPKITRTNNTGTSAQNCSGQDSASQAKEEHPLGKPRRDPAFQSLAPPNHDGSESLPPTGPSRPLNSSCFAHPNVAFPTSQLPRAAPSRQSVGESVHDEFWATCDLDKLTRLLRVYQEDVISVYPFIDIEHLITSADEVLRLERSAEVIRGQGPAPKGGLAENYSIDIKDLQIASVASATGIVIEDHGNSENSAALIRTIEETMATAIFRTNLGLKDLQLLIMLSIYHFHADADVMAWRTIGLAAREAIVLGLHRRAILIQRFPDEKDRKLAARVFWTIYVLDRRWSFGTGLCFALADRDIDGDLPLLGDDSAYLRCMVGYGHLCSAMWAELMPLGSHGTPSDTQEVISARLDFKVQEWLETIPSDLQLRHPRLGLAMLPQPPVLQNLRALLYLRANHARLLIHRYFLLTPDRIKTYPARASLSVEIAQDSIQVLVHLHKSSDIYRRQQAAFNYFLISALAVLFLAICNDSETFAGPCKTSLHAAMELLRQFSSSHCRGSRRLWRSVRNIIPRLRVLEQRRAQEALHDQVGNVGPGQEDLAGDASTADSVQSAAQDAAAGLLLSLGGSATMFLSGQTHAAVEQGEALSPTPEEVAHDMSEKHDPLLHSQDWGATPDLTTPNFVNMSSELLGLFESFEHGPPMFQAYQQELPEGRGAPQCDNWLAPGFTSEDTQGQISWQFNDLIW